MMVARADPFGNLDEFQPKTRAAKPVDAEAIDQLAQDNGFPSRQALPAKPAAPKPAKAAVQTANRRRRTGRNRQINVKARDDTIELFYKLANHEDVPLGEILDRALKAYEKLNG